MENGNRQHFDKIMGGYVKEVKEIDKQAENLEEQLKELKAKRRQLTEFTIPDYMIENGFTDCRLLDDTKITIKPLYYARVIPDKSLLFYEWLRNNGHGGLIKAHFEVLTRDPNVIPLLVEFCKYINEKGGNVHIDYEVGEMIHWKTLEMWFKEMTEKGQSVPDELFDNHLGQRAVIKDK
jgi:hypothetical protein